MFLSNQSTSYILKYIHICKCEKINRFSNVMLFYFKYLSETDLLSPLSSCILYLCYMKLYTQVELCCYLLSLKHTYALCEQLQEEQVSNANPNTFCT